MFHYRHHVNLKYCFHSNFYLCLYLFLLFRLKYILYLPMYCPRVQSDCQSPQAIHLVDKLSAIHLPAYYPDYHTILRNQMVLHLVKLMFHSYLSMMKYFLCFHAILSHLVSQHKIFRFLHSPLILATNSNLHLPKHRFYIQPKPQPLVRFS